MEEFESLVRDIIQQDEWAPSEAPEKGLWEEVEKMVRENRYTWDVNLTSVPLNMENPKVEEAVKDFIASVEPSVRVDRVGVGYAYSIRIGLNSVKELALLLYQAGEAREDLSEKLYDLAESIRHMLWDSLQYIEWLSEYSVVNRVYEECIFLYRDKIRYLIVKKYGDEIELLVPEQLKGFFIGKQGHKVKKLEEKFKMRFKVYGDVELTYRYMVEEEGQIPQEAEDIIDRIIPEINELFATYKVSPELFMAIVKKKLKL